MEEKSLKEYLPGVGLLVLCIVLPYGTYSTIRDWQGILLFHFTHANIFHLLANFSVIARFKPRWASLPWAYLSATTAAICPFSGMSIPTCGISAMIFAMLARRDAILGIWNWKLLVVNLMLGIIPNINWRIHLFAYLISFAIWKIKINSYRFRDLSPWRKK